MSGGVDSSVTAGILKDKGYNVVGVHLRCWNVDGCAQQDAEDARRAAETLGIPFYVFDFEKEYRQKVVDYMVKGYKSGITPNPDVMCNQEIKFGMFYKRAMELGADYVATGHYVRLRTLRVHPVSPRELRPILKLAMANWVTAQGSHALYAAKDGDKDQSYFLWTLTQQQLAHCLFPLGDLIKKTDVRRLAKKYKLPNAEKKDSQGICFLGQVSLPEFLDQFIPSRAGIIVNTTGKQIGNHKGSHYFTIGQRRGLGVGGSATPLYVAAKDIKKNIVTLAPEGDDSLYSKQITLTGMNFITPSLKIRNSKLEIPVLARVRYRQPLFPATLKGKTIVFSKPQKFVAIGQSAVFYDKRGCMLGGGIIVSVK